jgi:hypothetical protein
MPARRFPPPWSVEELDACFVATDSTGQKLAYVYFEDEQRFAMLAPQKWLRLDPSVFDLNYCANSKKCDEAQRKPTSRSKRPRKGRTARRTPNWRAANPRRFVVLAAFVTPTSRH